MDDRLLIKVLTFIYTWVLVVYVYKDIYMFLYIYIYVFIYAICIYIYRNIYMYIYIYIYKYLYVSICPECLKLGPPQCEFHGTPLPEGTSIFTAELYAIYITLL